MTSTLQPLDSFEVPRFSGLATFMRAPYVPDAEGIDIALVGVPFDFNLSRKGTRFGPSQVREMSRLIRRFPSEGGESPFDLCNVADVGDAAASAAEFATEREAIKAACQLVFEQDIPFVEQVHENYKLRDAAGVDTRFSPFWEANIQRFQQCVADLVPVDERTRN